MTDWSEDRFEDDAAKAVEGAFLRYWISRGAVMVTATAWMLIAELGYVAAAGETWALQLAPGWVMGFTGSALTVEVVWLAGAFRDKKRDKGPLPPFRKRVRTAVFWVRQGQLAVYDLCLAIVLIHLYGRTAGLVATGCYAALSWTAYAVGRWSIPLVQAAGDFAADTSRPDTPEI